MTTLNDTEEQVALEHGIHGLEYIIAKASGIEGADDLDAVRKRWEHSLKVLREMLSTYERVPPIQCPLCNGYGQVRDKRGEATKCVTCDGTGAI